ncbi:25518_t:CDS:2, partial [Racocetra persica]
MSGSKSIQNTLKYDKKSYYPSEGTVISKQYGIKNAQNPKEQAVLLGIVSAIMPALLTKYPDLLVVDSTGYRNSLNFPNTAFIVKLNEPHGRVVATFVNNKETIPVIDLMFKSKLQIATRIANSAVAETIASYFQKYWFGGWVGTSICADSGVIE